MVSLKIFSVSSLIFLSDFLDLVHVHCLSPAAVQQYLLDLCGLLFLLIVLYEDAEYVHSLELDKPAVHEIPTNDTIASQLRGCQIPTTLCKNCLHEGYIHI